MSGPWTPLLICYCRHFVPTCKFDAELVEKQERLDLVTVGAGDDLPGDAQHPGQQVGAGLAVERQHQLGHSVQQPAGNSSISNIELCIVLVLVSFASRPDFLHLLQHSRSENIVL